MRSRVGRGSHGGRGMALRLSCHAHWLRHKLSQDSETVWVLERAHSDAGAFLPPPRRPPGLLYALTALQLNSALEKKGISHRLQL